MAEAAVRLRRAALVYHQKLDRARQTGEELAALFAQLGTETALCSSESLEEMGRLLQGADLVLSLGGDGTILRTSHLAGPLGIPILGVNLGRVGFLSEVEPEEAPAALSRIAAGEGWIEERIMLAVERPATAESFLALNDAVLSRGFKARVIGVGVWIDEEFVTEVLADGMVVSSPTGSTSYNLALGGPVLHPQAEAFVCTAIATYPRPRPTLVVPASHRVGLRLHSDHGAGLTLDGQDAYPLEDGEEIRVARAPQPVRFWRLRPRGYFYRAVMERLG